VFDYVRDHRPWQYITGNVTSDRNWSFPAGTELPAVLGMIASGSFLQKMKRHKIPVVNISERQAGVGTARVLPDNVEAGRRAAAYFLEKKFTHFAFSGCEEFAFSRLRHQGFEEVLRAAGHTCVVQNFGSGKWPMHSLDPLPEVGEWVKSLPKPCAVFTHADDHARRVLNECSRLRIRVPEEVAVLGCDNDELECELSPTPISSVAFPLRRLGYEAAGMVERLLAGEEPPEGPVRLSPTGIVTRRSTDVIAVKDPIVARAVSYISAHAAEPIDVSNVVKASGASRRYLERRFNTLLGRTPKQEILRVRVGIAKRLLSETLLPMPDIAGASGFTDSKMLSSVFVRDMGMTPSEFRRSVRAASQQEAEKKERSSARR
jgi:LacI family transcriptional regulator